LKRRILVTEPVARPLDVPWEDLGRHPLRGVAEPVTILSPIQSSSAV
jgi:class 3 adenylate cyclase